MKIKILVLFVLICVSCSKDPDLPALSGGRDLKITGALLQYYADSTPTQIERFVIFPVSPSDTLLLDTNMSYTAELLLWSVTDTLTSLIQQDANFYDFLYSVPANDATNFAIGITDKDLSDRSLGLKSKWTIGSAFSDSAILTISGVYYKENTKGIGVRSDSLFQTRVNVKLGN